MYLHEIVIFFCLILFYINDTIGYSTNNEEKDLMGLDIKGYIEKLLQDFREKIPEEITFSDQNILIPQFLEEYIAGTLELSNISFSGLKEFNANIDYGLIVPIPKRYSITIDHLSWLVNYKSDLTVYDTKLLSIFGDGSANVTLRNLQIQGDISVTIIPVGAETTVDIDWDGVTFGISGLLDDEIFSSQIGEFVGSAVTKLSESFKKPLSLLFKNIANFIIKLVLPHSSPSFRNETIVKLNEEISDKYIVNEK